MVTQLHAVRKMGGVASLLVAGIVTCLPHESVAAGRICPQYLARYCVEDADGIRSITWTNPCLAELKHLHVLHRGRCQSK